MEAFKGNCENSKNEAISALRRIKTVRSKEPQPSLLVLQRKGDVLKKEIVNFGTAQWALLEKGSGKLSDEERNRYVTDYDELGDRMHDELDIALEIVHYWKILFLLSFHQLLIKPLVLRNLLS